MKTNSKLDSMSSTLTNDNKENNFTITLGVASDRKVNTSSILSELNVPSYKAVKFTEKYGTPDIINSQIIFLGPTTGHKNSHIQFVLMDSYVTSEDDNDFDDFLSGYFREEDNDPDNVAYNSFTSFADSQIVSRLISINKPTIVRFLVKNYRGDADNHGDQKPCTINFGNTDTISSIGFTGTWSSFKSTWAKSEHNEQELENKFFENLDSNPIGGSHSRDLKRNSNYGIYIPDVSNSGKMCLAPAFYYATNKEQFDGMVQGITQNIHNTYFTEWDNLSMASYYIATNIQNHSTFPTVFNLNLKLATVDVTKATINVGGSEILTLINNVLPSDLSTSTFNIGTIKSSEQNCLPIIKDNTYTQDLIYEDSISISSTKFILNGETINIIVNKLSNPQSSVTSETGSDAFTDYLFPDENSANNPTDGNHYDYKYNSGRGLFFAYNPGSSDKYELFLGATESEHVAETSAGLECKINGGVNLSISKPLFKIPSGSKASASYIVPSQYQNEMLR